jgi:hypothetical protein
MSARVNSIRCPGKNVSQTPTTENCTLSDARIAPKWTQAIAFCILFGYDRLQNGYS